MDVQKCFAITIQYFCTWIPYIFDSFEGRVWDLTALVPDHCLFFYFATEPLRIRFLTESQRPYLKDITHVWEQSAIQILVTFSA